MRLKDIDPIEWLVITAVVAIIAFAVLAAVRNGPSTILAPDGTLLHRVQIDGHDYIKSGDTLTHSASCAACTQKER